MINTRVVEPINYAVVKQGALSAERVSLAIEAVRRVESPVLMARIAVPSGNVSVVELSPVEAVHHSVMGSSVLSALVITTVRATNCVAKALASPLRLICNARPVTIDAIRCTPIAVLIGPVDVEAVRFVARMTSASVEPA